MSSKASAKKKCSKLYSTICLMISTLLWLEHKRPYVGKYLIIFRIQLSDITVDPKSYTILLNKRTWFLEMFNRQLNRFYVLAYVIKRAAKKEFLWQIMKTNSCTIFFAWNKKCKIFKLFQLFTILSKLAWNAFSGQIFLLLEKP